MGMRNLLVKIKVGNHAGQIGIVENPNCVLGYQDVTVDGEEIQVSDDGLEMVCGSDDVYTDRKFVMEHMSCHGSRRFMLDNNVWSKCYLMCDGFGKISLDDAVYQCWDWSHVRDSSEQAIASVAKYIREVVYNG